MRDAFFPLVVTSLAAGCVLSFFGEHATWLPILMALAVVGGLVRLGRL